MALDFTDRQARTITAAITTISALTILVAIGLLGWLATLFLRAFSGVFLPLTVGAIGAMVFRPYYDLLRTTWRLPVAGAVAAVFLSALIPLGLFAYWFGRIAVTQAIELAARAPALWEQYGQVWVDEQLPALLEDYAVADRVRDMVVEQQAAVIDWVQSVGVGALTAGADLAAGVGALFSWVIAPVYFAYFLSASGLKLDTAKVLPFLKQESRDDVLYLLNEFVNIIVAFFRGQLIIAFLQGLLFAAGFSVVGLSYGFVIGLALGLLNIIPYLGNIVGLAVAVPIALFQGGGPNWTTCGLVLVVFVVVQQIEGWFLTPKIMGDRTGLHFMAIIVAIFFWGTALGGILGMILAIPLTAFLASLWRLAREKYIPEIL